MTDAAPALLAALDDGRVDITAAVEIVAQATGTASPAIDERTRTQFKHAFEALLREALQGGGDQRSLVLEAAVPALVANGQGALEIVERQVALFVALSSAMLAAVDESDHAEATLWLSRYASGFVREVAERALAAERARSR